MWFSFHWYPRQDLIGEYFEKSLPATVIHNNHPVAQRQVNTWDVSLLSTFTDPIVDLI